jgi:UDP-N-acetyl-D-glucosamine dehydrogenase
VDNPILPLELFHTSVFCASQRQHALFCGAAGVRVLNKSDKPLKGAYVLVSGLAYKKDVDDSRESPALKIIQLLSKEGAAGSYNDPHIPRCAGMRHYPGFDMTSTPLKAKALQEADLVLLVTDHSAYDYAWIASQARLIMDTRNAFRALPGNHIYRA